MQDNMHSSSLSQKEADILSFIRFESRYKLFNWINNYYSACISFLEL